ncbi:CPBP family intramembrane glutamic endopeptidase [Ktedonosporobacter rubrisoli]|nr:CPBP family intramembrane glutamic endopeptidase [Ktedonosporobacter rubrisoli]
MSHKVESTEVGQGNLWPDNQRLKAVVTLGIGVFLWFLPSILVPDLKGPVVELIDTLLRAVGLLSASASSFEGGFAAALTIRWLSVGLLCLFVVFVQREPLSSLGIRAPKWRDVALAFGIGVLALILSIVSYLVIHGGAQVDANTTAGQVVRTLGLVGRIHLDLNAAVFEEVFYRSCLIECLIRISGRAWLAGIVSFVAFVGLHYFSGSASLAQTVTVVFIAGVALISLYLLRRNVWLCIIVHAVMDVAMIIAPQ